MTNAIIYKFSGTGNTAKICELYKAEFERQGVETTIYNVKGDFANLPNPNNFDLIGFAYPIHAFNAPHIMLDLAKKLAPSSSAKKDEPKEYFVIKSSGEPLALNNISSYKMRAILKRKGYRQFAEYHYVMPYNMIFRHNDDTATRMWHTAQKLAPIEANEVLSHQKHMLKPVFLGHTIAFVFRIEHPAMRVNGKAFKVDKDKCIGCGACAKNCPVQNIQIIDGKFKFANECLMCARCSFSCPTDAFKIGILNGWRINGKYNMNYDGESQKPVHEWYCKKAYKRYFENAEAKIKEHEKAAEANDLG